MMKRLAMLALVLALLLGMTSSALAVPENVSYDTTKAFLEVLDSEDVKYTYEGIGDSGEQVRVAFNLDDGSCVIKFYFNEDNQHCSIRVWNLIDFDESDLSRMYKVCSRINSDYKYTTFYVDESDNSITVSMDLILLGDGAASICDEALYHVASICNEAMASLAPYRK